MKTVVFLLSLFILGHASTEQKEKSDTKIGVVIPDAKEPKLEGSQSMPNPDKSKLEAMKSIPDPKKSELEGSPIPKAGPALEGFKPSVEGGRGKKE